MEYGRLVVLGYSSYRVATVRQSNTPASAQSELAMARPPPGTIHANQHLKKSSKALCQLWEPIGDQNAHYTLQKRRRANGVMLQQFHQVTATTSDKIDPKAWTKHVLESIDKQNHPLPSYLMCTPMNDTHAHVSVMQYGPNAATDMFQIGRMPCAQNDVVIPGPRVGASGTISRFAARIVCSREPPFACRLYAGGFDVTRKMTTAGHALKFCNGCKTWMKNVALDHKCLASETDNQSQHAAKMMKHDDFDQVTMDLSEPSNVPVDGLTKNGVRLWLPAHKQWFEVSVNGNLYAIEPRAASTAKSSSSSSRNSAFNRPQGDHIETIQSILTDGAIIDLGGVQLQFQTSLDNNHPSSQESESIVSQLEKLNVQCPVQLHSLRFATPLNGELVDSDQIPHVFPACGHVFGYEERIAQSKTCPLCRTPGHFVPLLLKENSKLQEAQANAMPECVFNPCGHAITSALASYYASILMPNGRAICPFCAVHLDINTPFARLYLYRDEEF